MLWLYLLAMLTHLHSSDGQSLFNSADIVRNGPVTGGENLAPRFLPGGDMDKFSLPEDTPVGTIVSRHLATHKTAMFNLMNERLSYRCTG